MPSGQLLSLGSINIDIEMRIDHWPPPGDTAFAHGVAILGGGKAANVAFLARRLGVDAKLIGCMGQDELAHRVLEGLAVAGVDLQHVQHLADTATGLATVLVGPDGEKTIIQAQNANLVWDATAIEAAIEAIAAAPKNAVLVADLEVPPEVVGAALETACTHHLPVILDPTPTSRASAQLLQGIDYLTPNAAEASRLTGAPVDNAEQAIKAGRTFLESGVLGAALIKLPSGGCVVVSREEVFLVNALQVTATDKTGAGDAFAGALGVAMLEGKPLKEAARFAVATATLAVTGYGAQPSYPTRTEIERLLNDHELGTRAAHGSAEIM